MDQRVPRSSPLEDSCQSQQQNQLAQPNMMLSLGQSRGPFPNLLGSPSLNALSQQQQLSTPTGLPVSGNATALNSALVLPISPGMMPQPISIRSPISALATMGSFQSGVGQLNAPTLHSPSLQALGSCNRPLEGLLHVREPTLSPSSASTPRPLPQAGPSFPSKDDLSRQTAALLAACASVLPQSLDSNISSGPSLLTPPLHAPPTPKSHLSGSALPAAASRPPASLNAALAIAQPSGHAGAYHSGPAATHSSSFGGASSSSDTRLSEGERMAQSEHEPSWEAALARMKEETAIEGKRGTEITWSDEDGPKKNVTAIYPRRSAEDRSSGDPRKGPVLLNESTLAQLFVMSLPDAANHLGISPTALKSACRKLGIKKWPYRRPDRPVGHKSEDDE